MVGSIQLALRERGLRERKKAGLDGLNIVGLLKACTDQKDLVHGSRLHAYIQEHNLLEKNSCIASAVVSMYATCGAIDEAQKVLGDLPVQNVVAWTALMTGYTQQGQGEEALKCFDNMLGTGHTPDVVAFTCALKACGSIGAASKGEEIHEKIVNLGMLKKNIVLGSTLVDMYARCGSLVKAWQVLDELPVRNVVSWTALIAGYVQHEQGKEALKCFDSMQHDGLSPNAVTFVCALKACGTIGDAARGEQIHDTIVSLAMLEENIVLGNALVDMYVRCGALVKAHQVFSWLSVRNVVTWTGLIAGYVQEGQGEEALKWFDNMQHSGQSPDVFIFTCALKACGNMGAAMKGEQIHDKIVRLGMLEKSIALGRALVDMYVRCDALTSAQQVFMQLPLQDVVSWTVLIAGYMQQGKGEEALKCFDSMQRDGHSPDAFSFTCALRACGSIGAACEGEQIHDKIVSLGMLEKNVVLWSSLVDMYARCGVLAKAEEVFTQLPVQDVVSWTALIAGYALHGRNVEAVNCFERMQAMGLEPNSATLICMLNAYSHSGILDKAQMLFSAMSSKYGIAPRVEHYCCMVDLFGRAGKFNDALDVIEEMASSESLSVWAALLSACHKWAEVKIWRLAFEHALHLDEQCWNVYLYGLYLNSSWHARGCRED